jgi:uncharacterized SAM-binding protein YcdF (DUF218 family)
MTVWAWLTRLLGMPPPPPPPWWHAYCNASGLLCLLAVYVAAVWLITLWRVGRLYWCATVPRVDALLVLGGPEHDRELHAAALLDMAPYAQLPLVVSSGSENLRVCRNDVATRAQTFFDRQAVDTLTNFTTTASLLQQLRVRHVLVVTSAYHVARYVGSVADQNCFLVIVVRN